MQQGDKRGVKKEREEGSYTEGEMEGGEWGVKCRVQDKKDEGMYLCFVSVREIIIEGRFVLKIHSVVAVPLMLNY